MNKTMLALFAVLMPLAAAAAAPKTYQVTGPVLEVKEGIVVVQKGKDKWEIAVDKAPAGLKAGDKVTIEYVMTAKTVEVKADKAAKADAAPKADAKAKAKK